jgi:hypothetical protein
VTHLSAEQIAQWAAGERTADAELHMAACPRCRGEVSEIEDVLAQFRSSARSVESPIPALAPSHRMMWPRLVAVAAAAALLVAAPVYREHRQRERAARDRQDAQLLQQVDAEISRAVPGSMDPLVSLVSWNSASTERNQHEGHK